MCRRSGFRVTSPLLEREAGEDRKVSSDKFSSLFISNINIFPRFDIPIEGYFGVTDTVFESMGEWDFVDNGIGEPIQVNTVYKPKAKKIRPVDFGGPSIEAPDAKVDWEWYEKHQKKYPYLPKDERNQEFDEFLIPRFDTRPEGFRLTPERIDELNISSMLSNEERRLMIQMLLNREAVIAFGYEHIRRINHDICPPVVIQTIPHKAWQLPTFQVPRALAPEIDKIFLEQQKAGILEESNGPYRNPWFSVQKKSGKPRIVRSVTKANSVTLREASVVPNVDEVSEELAGNLIASVIDFFSGFDQMTLAVESRDLYAIPTERGMMRNTTIVQGATNSAQQFARGSLRIIKPLYPNVVVPFADDYGIKGPKTNYNGEEVRFDIRRFVLEHIQNIDKVLERLERAGATIGAKSCFGYAGLEMVGFVVGPEGRSPATAKIAKIVEWPPCENETEIRAFLGVCSYFRYWIEHYAQKAEPLYSLLRKDAEFIWGEEHDRSMQLLKEHLTSAPCLMPIDHSPNAGLIILLVDASLKGWGAILGQEASKGKRTVARYESGLWSKAEQNYDATKRECRGLLKALKKCRTQLYGVFFRIETDAAVLVHQLSRAGSDLMGALVTRWIAWIRLFDFEIVHVPGKRHTAADGLSRRPRVSSDDIDEQEEDDIDEWILDQLGINIDINSIESKFQDTNVKPLPLSYSEASQRIARYLTTMRFPKDLSATERKAFKRHALLFTVIDGHLFKLSSKNIPLRRVIDLEEERGIVMKYLHDYWGHKGVESTYRQVADRYYWEKCYESCKEYVSSCPDCQFRASNQKEEPLHPTFVSACWETIAFDVVSMPRDAGKLAFLLIRCGLCGWPEGGPLGKVDSITIGKELWKSVCRHGVPKRVVHDGGPENKKYVGDFCTTYEIENIRTSAYHAPGNGMIERGHQPVLDALSKLAGGGKQWVKHWNAG